MFDAFMFVIAAFLCKIDIHYPFLCYCVKLHLPSKQELKYIWSVCSMHSVWSFCSCCHCHVSQCLLSLIVVV